MQVFVNGENMSFEREIEDRRIGGVKVFKGPNGKRVYEKELDFDNKSQLERINEWLDKRSTLSHENYWHPIQFKSFSERHYCSMEHKVRYYVEAVDNDLTKMINETAVSEQGLGSHALTELLNHTLQGMCMMEQNGLTHGHLSPTMIGWKRKEDIFFICENPLFDYNTLRGKLLNNPELFLSPKMFIQLIENKYDPLTDGNIKSDVFSLGMILLYASTGDKVYKCYDPLTKKFDTERLNESIKKMIGLHFNTPSFVNAVIRMLKIEENQRPTFKELLYEGPQMAPVLLPNVTDSGANSIHSPNNNKSTALDKRNYFVSPEVRQIIEFSKNNPYQYSDSSTRGYQYDNFTTQQNSLKTGQNPYMLPQGPKQGLQLQRSRSAVPPNSRGFITIEKIEPMSYNSPSIQVSPTGIVNHQPAFQFNTTPSYASVQQQPQNSQIVAFPNNNIFYGAPTHSVATFAPQDFHTANSAISPQIIKEPLHAFPRPSQPTLVPTTILSRPESLPPNPYGFEGVGTVYVDNIMNPTLGSMMMGSAPPR